jgi:hypothetical protein
MNQNINHDPAMTALWKIPEPVNPADPAADPLEMEWSTTGGEPAPSTQTDEGLPPDIAALLRGSS